MENTTSRKSVFARWTSIRVLMVLFDIVAVNLSYYTTLLLRYFVDHQLVGRAAEYINAFWTFAPYYTVFSIVVFACFRLYSGMWKYAGRNDLCRIILANAVTAIGYVLGSWLFVKRMTISYYVLGACVQMLLITASRFSPKMISSIAAQARNRKASINVMIIGTGEAGHAVCSNIENDPDNAARPTCYLTAHANENLSTINGLPVLTDIDRLEEHIAKYKIGSIIIADPILPTAARKQIKAFCRSNNIGVQEFSGYFHNTGDAMLLSNILEYVEGHVEIAIGAVSQMFDSGEEALNALEGKYEIKGISGTDDKLVIRLSKHQLPNSESKWRLWNTNMVNTVVYRLLQILLARSVARTVFLLPRIYCLSANAVIADMRMKFIFASFVGQFLMIMVAMGIYVMDVCQMRIKLVCERWNLE